MPNLNKSTSVAASAAAILGASAHDRTRQTSAVKIETPTVTARDWFALGSRVPYDPQAKRILRPGDATGASDIVQVFRRTANEAAADTDTVWTSFLPGWPDGSFGWAKVDRHLVGKSHGPRLFVEYIGHGDSDKPSDYPYGTVERADLVEALWEAEGITATFIVGFDYSSIVALELLSRQQERRDQGIEPATRINGVLLINGGLFVDAHTHPWFTTPVLKSPLGGLVTSLAQRSRVAFAELMKPLWSKDYEVTAEEIDELREAIGRRNGVAALSKSAGFVDQHKRHAERWDLGRLFHAAKDTVAFHIVGSEDDPFEWRQAQAARERLGAEGLDVRILPGGHLTTSEHPDLLAQIIQEVGPQH
ncbi:MAG: alpha/beta hydrolase [Alphaproteobacteria bacterium]|nr:alpha/beta hydrolase [Alphaproteobacteria bacterium]